MIILIFPSNPGCSLPLPLPCFGTAHVFTHSHKKREEGTDLAESCFPF